MHAVIAALAEAAATPAPTPAVDPDLVTPGPLGFAAIIFVAVAVILLVADMNRRIRRARVREDIRQQLDAEERAARGEPPLDPDADRRDG